MRRLQNFFRDIYRNYRAVSLITPGHPRYPMTLQDTPGNQYFRILTLNNSTYDGKESQINTICPKYDIFFQW